MKNVSNQTRKAMNEKHLLQLLEENQTLLQSVNQWYLDIYKDTIEPDMHPEEHKSLIQFQIQELIEKIKGVGQRLKANYKSPSSTGVNQISKLHFRCIEEYQEIKVKLSSN